jgi:predicted PurR-regulated permease PerM
MAWLGIATACLVVLWLLGPVLTPFAVGAVLAYALHPLVESLQARRWPRALAVSAVVLGLMLALAGLLLLLVPIIAQEIPLIRQQLPSLLDRIQQALSPVLAQFGLQADMDFSRLKALITEYLQSNGDSALGTLVHSIRLGGSVALAVVGNLVLIPVVLFYFLLDWTAFIQRMRQLIPPHLRDKADGFMGETDAVLSQYLRGQIMVMLIMALWYACGLALFGLDLALPIGLFTGLAMFIPYLGFGIGLLMALTAGFLEFASLKALVMVLTVYGTGQLIEGFWLTPRLVGERIGLHALAVIFALLAFGQLFGFVGILVALPASAVALVALRRIKAAYLASDIYKGV